MSEGAKSVCRNAILLKHIKSFYKLNRYWLILDHKYEVELPEVHAGYKFNSYWLIYHQYLWFWTTSMGWNHQSSCWGYIKRLLIDLWSTFLILQRMCKVESPEVHAGAKLNTYRRIYWFCIIIVRWNHQKFMLGLN